MNKIRAWAEFKSALDASRLRESAILSGPRRRFVCGGDAQVVWTHRSVVMAGAEWFCSVDFDDGGEEFMVSVETPEVSAMGTGFEAGYCSERNVADVAESLFRSYLGLPFKSEQGCPDGGECHHKCIEKCWRVKSCAPLSGVFPDNHWPEDVKNENLA